MSRRTFIPPQGFPICSIDVECVAIGHDHNARAVGQIAVVVSLVATGGRAVCRWHARLVRHAPVRSTAQGATGNPAGPVRQRALECLREARARRGLLPDSSHRASMGKMGHTKQEQRTRALTPLYRLLCRLTKDMLETQGVPLQQALAVVRQQLPPNAILVGQNISKDVEWLGLR